MDRATEDKLKVYLSGAIKDALDTASASNDLDLPWIGDGLHEIMAQAALAVLRGIADAQAYLDENGMLRD